MAWNMKDYPVSMKNMDQLERKKAIDIANALLADGYPDDRAIPIAMSQAEKWYENAREQEKRAFIKEDNPSKNDQHDINERNAELIDANEVVKYTDNGWAVMAQGAKKASAIFDTKKEAVAAAKSIARNKRSNVKEYRKDGSLID
ncbi:DUF2188 domain-containing protein [Paucilactobacillus kaifaensis]|uniref:DUF2188 domain-containing protein n=1 Tax=Paucilactobacillus kaifaensis TaxID=2559921 RepID=UPI0010F73008|nr:DUF2188 domain-containing protein [Paucilactobacillus kaifaensis]